MRIQFKLRTLMAVIAALAIAVFLERTRERWASFRNMAAAYARKETALLASAAKHEADAAHLRREIQQGKARVEELDLDDRRNLEEFIGVELTVLKWEDLSARRFRYKAAYYTKLKEKYQRAAARPWRTLEE